MYTRLPRRMANFCVVSRITYAALLRCVESLINREAGNHQD